MFRVCCENTPYFMSTNGNHWWLNTAAHLLVHLQVFLSYEFSVSSRTYWTTMQFFSPYATIFLVPVGQKIERRLLARWHPLWQQKLCKSTVKTFLDAEMHLFLFPLCKSSIPPLDLWRNSAMLGLLPILFSRKAMRRVPVGEKKRVALPSSCMSAHTCCTSHIPPIFKMTFGSIVDLWLQWSSMACLVK